MSWVMSLAFYCMKIGIYRLVYLLVACLALQLGCRPVAAARVSVWVSIAPQKYFVERIGGDSVSVEVLVRPGQSPEMYAPSAAQMAQLARADLYFGIGVPIEAPLFRRMASSMPGVRVVQTGGLAVEEALAHDHHGHDHHAANDPHIWLDPLQMIPVVRMIQDALIDIEPERAALFRANGDALIGELTRTEVELAGQLAPYAGCAFFINHPALGHFAKRFGLLQRSIEHAGSSPSARRVAELVGEARAARAGAIFTQPEFGRTSATVLARAIDVEVVEVDLLAENYFENMRMIADSLVESFSK
jgi:zinc transport system substrate-binding protein